MNISQLGMQNFCRNTFLRFSLYVRVILKKRVLFLREECTFETFICCNYSIRDKLKNFLLEYDRLGSDKEK